MKILTLLLPVLLLAGCSTPTIDAAREAWHWDATRPPARASLPPAELAQLTNRIAGLALQRNEIRGRISAEPDINARQRLYAQLHEVGMQLSPLERQLAAAAPAR